MPALFSALQRAVGLGGEPAVGGQVSSMSVSTPSMAARVSRVGQSVKVRSHGRHFLTWRRGRIGAKSPLMLPRYSRPQMAAIWAPENRFRIWFEIEAHACDAMAELGIIPKDAAQAIWDGGKAMAALKADPAAEKIDAIERVTKHDVIAFTTWLGEFIGPQSRFVHQGLTSSDVLDTSFCRPAHQAADILLADVDRLLAALKKRAFEHKDTLTIGRSHGIHAEPTTFGVKLAGHYAAFTRNRARLVAARAEIATCAISGPVGTFANVDPRVEEHVAEEARPGRRAGLHAGHPARPPCRVLRGAGRRRLLGREPRHRDPPSAAHRGARSRGVLLRGPEGQLLDAAQAQSGADREPDRPRPRGASNTSPCAPLTDVLLRGRAFAAPRFERGFVGHHEQRIVGFPVLDEINISYQIATAPLAPIEVAPGGVALVEKVLDDAGLQYTARRIEDQGGAVRKCAISVPAQILAAVAFRADYKTGLVQVSLVNVDRFDRVSLEFASRAIDEPALEDLVRLILGRSDAFLHRAPLWGIHGRPSGS